ncbi:hypothetical protein [Sphingomonas sp. NIBR02145]|uniref:hypothetical protein n=1 Tax=Sphingomonas sp. NIBR02145 TaxID=3014784 RepID=UPI0022B4C9BA|nr:hypothetical protein [Sphingomonas sp. NIBR02145]WHU00927.1 hypothetical protein O3305_11915 [Sphingomonas sp. NIBR02145]
MSHNDGYEMNAFTEFDDKKAGDTLDVLIDLVSDLLPVTEVQYPSLRFQSEATAVEFCIRHSALHFSKTAGRLAAWVEDADHGKFAKIDALEAIVAAGLINSLKLADEIGVSGTAILSHIKEKYAPRDLTA